MGKKRIYTEAQKARNKITKAKWKLANPDYRAKWMEANPGYQAKWYQDNKEAKDAKNKAWTKANPDKKKALNAAWYQANKIEEIAKNKVWRDANPDKVKAWKDSFNLGYWVVYVLYNYDGLGNDYCGQTGNTYKRMQNHKMVGNNTENFEVLEKFDTIEEAYGFELTMHVSGCHGQHVSHY